MNLDKRDNKNKAYKSGDTSINTYCAGSSNRSKSNVWLVLAGIIIYAILFYVLRMFFDYPGCAAIIALNILVFIVFYALIMVAGGYISALLHNKKPNTQSIGASGAICGILGIYLAMAFILMGFGGIRSMVPTIAILLLMTFSPHIDSIGHFTGMGVGILCGVAVVYLL